MIFAHGPLGFIVSHSFIRRFWRNKLNRKQKWWLMILGFIGGIAPDFDLLYIYFVDATKSHRELPSHTIVLYFVLGVLAYCVALAASRKPFPRMAVLVFFAGVGSHLLTDNIIGQVAWFLPFSKEMYGLGDIAFLWPWLFLANFLIEFFFIAVFFWILIRWFSFSAPLRVVLSVLTVVFWIGMSVGVFFVDKHTVHLNLDFAHQDQDHDGQRNKDDTDLDGDGSVNSRDIDSDDDGISNLEAFQLAAEDYDDFWFDPADGRWFEFPSRLGFVSTVDVVGNLYYLSGIPLRPEMRADYLSIGAAYLSDADYDTNPQDAYFDNSIHNIRVWLSHTRRISRGFVVAPKPGDILFFGENGDRHIAVVDTAPENGEVVLIEAHTSHGAGKILLEDVVAREGEPTFLGRVLSSLFASDPKQ